MFGGGRGESCSPRGRRAGQLCGGLKAARDHASLSFARSQDGDALRCATVGEEWGECSNGGEAQIRVARDQGFQNCQQVGHARLLPSDQITVQLLWVKAYQSDSRGGARRRRATTCCHSRSSRGPKLTVGAS